ncbi:MAG: alpha-methylacyl-CoA racemase [Alphaproteobacteria bacterium]|nr:MAG: alpha-methylacyl-CoA racemase [Alphaproteobacteria bacterium]
MNDATQLPKGALEGIRVIEWAHAHMGPGGGMLLADLGAEVIHVEPPVIGDMMRRFTRVFGADFALPKGRNAFVEDINRNKKSIAVDLETDEGKEVIYQLVAKADVFLTNMRPRAVDKLRMDYDTLAAINPKLIYCHGSGYGDRGPERDSPGLEIIGLARGGIMLGSAFKEGPPVYPTVSVVDRLGGFGIGFAILSALVARERFGIGQRVSTSMLGWAINLQGVAVALAANTGQDPRPIPREETHDPLWNVYKCKDGVWIALGMIIQGEKFWPKLCEAIRRPDLENDPRFATQKLREENRRQLIELFDQTFAQIDSEEWIRLSKENDFIGSKVNTLVDLAEDEQVLANEYIVEQDHPVLGRWKYVPTPVYLSKTPVRVHSAAPELGEHTKEILTETLGYSSEEVAELSRKKVI